MPDSPKLKLTRRELLNYFLFASLSGAIGTVLGNRGDRVLDETLRLTEGLAKDVASAGRGGLFSDVHGGLVKDLFLWADGETLTTIPGTQHPQWGTKGHPADRLAQAFAGRGVDVAELVLRDNVHVDSNDVLPAGLGGDVAVFGSPVSNEVCAVLLGYEGDHPYSLRFIRGPLSDRLRWSFQIDEVSSSGAELKAWTGSPGKYPVPNWQIADMKSGISAGSLIRNDAGVNDYLVITRLRNFLDPVSYKSGRTITLMGGAHGLGTVGFGRLCRDHALLQSLSREIGTADAQILLEVRDPQQITDPGVLQRELYDQFPSTIILRDVELLQVPDHVYEEARMPVVERLKKHFHRQRQEWQWLA